MEGLRFSVFVRVIMDGCCKTQYSCDPIKPEIFLAQRSSLWSQKQIDWDGLDYAISCPSFATYFLEKKNIQLLTWGQYRTIVHVIGRHTVIKTDTRDPVQGSSSVVKKVGSCVGQDTSLYSYVGIDTQKSILIIVVTNLSHTQLIGETSTQTRQLILVY